MGKSPMCSFPLKYRKTVSIYASQHDGSPYLVLEGPNIPNSTSNKIPLRFFMDLRNLQNLQKFSAQIQRLLRVPFTEETKSFQLGGAVTAHVRVCEIVPGAPKEKVLWLDRWLLGVENEDGSFLMEEPVFKALMQRADYLISRMEDMIEEPHTEEIPYYLNEKTYIEVFTHPRLFRFTRKELKKDAQWSIAIQEPALLEFLSNKEVIEKYVREKEEATFPLSQDTICKVCNFRGVTYVGFGRVDKDGHRIKGAGMNLDTPGFMKLYDNIDNLIESMYVAPLKKLNVFNWDILPYNPRKTENIKADAKEVQQQQQKQKQHQQQQQQKQKQHQQQQQQKQHQQQQSEQPPLKRPRLSLIIKPKDLPTPKESEADMQKEENEDSDSCVVLDTPPSSPGSMGQLQMVIPPTPEKLEKTRARRPQLKQYRYKWLNHQGRCMYTCPMWFFYQADCLHDASETKPMTELEPLLEIETRMIERFGYDDIVEMFIVEVLSRAIGEEVAINCQGCLYDAPGQVAHMEGGCLSEWEDLVDLNLTRCTDVFKLENYIYWGRCFLESMGYPIINLEKDIQSLMEQWGEDTLSQKVKEKKVGEEIVAAITKFKTM